MPQFLLAVSEQFGDSYLTYLMLPVFLVAVGDNADLTYFPSTIHSRIKGNGLFMFVGIVSDLVLLSNCYLIAGLRPKTAVAEKLASMCVLPLLLAGVLGSPSKHEQLADYLRKLLVEGAMKENHSVKCSAEINNAVRFVWLFSDVQLSALIIYIFLQLIDVFYNAAHLKNIMVWYLIFCGKWSSAPMLI